MGFIKRDENGKIIEYDRFKQHDGYIECDDNNNELKYFFNKKGSYRIPVVESLEDKVKRICIKLKMNYDIDTVEVVQKPDITQLLNQIRL